MTEGQESNQESKGFGFGLGKMKELKEAFAKAQQVQQGAQELQKELDEMDIEGQSSDGIKSPVAWKFPRKLLKKMPMNFRNW